MTFNLTEYNQDAYDTLFPLRQDLEQAGIPVAVLPREASTYKEVEDSGHITIIFRNSQRIDTGIIGAADQEVQLNLEIRISLSDRYTNDPLTSNAAVEWVIDRITNLLTGHIPPKGKAYIFEGHTLYPPQSGRWEADLRFSCIVRVVPEINPLPLVQVIETLGSVNTIVS